MADFKLPTAKSYPGNDLGSKTARAILNRANSNAQKFKQSSVGNLANKTLNFYKQSYSSVMPVAKKMGRFVSTAKGDPTKNRSNVGKNFR